MIGQGGYMKGLPSFLSTTVYIYDESYEDGSAPASYIYPSSSLTSHKTDRTSSKVMLILQRVGTRGSKSSLFSSPRSIRTWPVFSSSPSTFLLLLPPHYIFSYYIVKKDWDRLWNVSELVEIELFPIRLSLCVCVCDSAPFGWLIEYSPFMMLVQQRRRLNSIPALTTLQHPGSGQGWMKRVSHPLLGLYTRFSPGTFHFLVVIYSDTVGIGGVSLYGSFLLVVAYSLVCWRLDYLPTI